MSVESLKKHIKEDDGLVISEGTHDITHLLCKAFDLLQHWDINPKLRQEIRACYTEEPSLNNVFYGEAELKDEMEEIAQELLNTTIFSYFNNEVAPDGFSFGAHEGDGSLFGFWRLKE